MMHLQCTKNIIPWLLAYDWIHYSRYLSVYLCEMLCLVQSHPAAHQQMIRGEFAVQRSASASFSQVPVDQALEQTITRDMKTSGGIIGFSLRPGAVERWMLTAHLRASFTRACKDLAGISKQLIFVHKDQKASNAE